MRDEGHDDIEMGTNKGKQEKDLQVVGNCDMLHLHGRSRAILGVRRSLQLPHVHIEQEELYK